MQLEPSRHQGQKWGPLTYAQHFDDGMILNLFSLMGYENPSYLDLGANHPFIISNTALLYERGSRGVNVEANPLLMEEFKKHRPLDKNINVGVALEEGMKKFYMFSDDSGLNTFCEKEMKGLSCKVQKEIDLPVTTINKIMEKYCHGIWPDLLLTDIEGLDYDVLKSADFSQSSPKVIVSETRRHSSEPVKKLLHERGYFCYCRMSENLFFVREEYRAQVY